MKAWTDYPIIELGDTPYVEAPVREVEILRYDGDKYCHVLVCGIKTSIKAGYLYYEPGRCNEEPYPRPISRTALDTLVNYIPDIPDDFPSEEDIRKDRVTLIHERDAALKKLEKSEHQANEWADCVVNSLQWIRNISDGISTPREAIESIESNIRHCQRALSIDEHIQYAREIGSNFVGRHGPKETAFVLAEEVERLRKHIAELQGSLS